MAHATGISDRTILRVGIRETPLRRAFRLHRESTSAGLAQCRFVDLKAERARLSTEGKTSGEPDLGNVAIVGAGIAGLHAALQLSTSNTPVKITMFEASSEEGGRLYSHHFKEDPSVYCEIGAMRLPDRTTHPLLHNLLDFLQQEDNRKKLEAANLVIEQIPYHMSDEHGNGRVFVNGVRDGPSADSPILTSKQADAKARQEGATALGFFGKIPNTGQTAGEMLDGVMQKYVDMLREAATQGQEALNQKFIELATGDPPLDQLSLAQYLKDHERWGDDQIAYVEAMTDQTNAFKVSFMEQLIDFYEFNSQEWTTIKGGLQRLSKACRHLLGYDPGFSLKCNHRITRVQLVDDKVELWGVHTPKTGDMRGGNQGSQPRDSPEFSKSVSLGKFDRVLLALPPIAVRLMEVPDTWSGLKREALRAMRYDPIRKIGLLFKTRWWETLQANPIEGGQTVTDLPSRWIVYPSNDVGGKGKGALLCYSWTNDAYLHLTMTRAEKVEQALRDIETVHGSVVREQFLEAFPFEWSLSYAGGIAFFAPGQWSRYYSTMIKPEGRVYFAGEHLSVHHAWVEGALDSSHQAVIQMKRDLMEEAQYSAQPAAMARLMPMNLAKDLLPDDPLEVPERATT